MAADAPPEGAPRDVRGGLSGLLRDAARAHPGRMLLRDVGDRTAWCGRPTITWSYATAAEIVGRIGRGLAAWRLPPGSRIGLWFSGGAEAVLAHLAVEAAGHLPCLMPATWDADALSAGIEAAGLAAVLTEGRAGPRRPAEILARTAVRHYGLRYLAAFGPGVPDGVISLDAMALERGVPARAASCGLVTFLDGDPRRPVHRDAAALEAAITAHGRAVPLAEVERILTLLPSHDLRGLVTGIGAALAGGGSLESLVPFEEAAFRAALLHPVPTRLVAPGRIEAALAAFALPGSVRAVNLVRRAPGPAGGAARCPIASPSVPSPSVPSPSPRPGAPAEPEAASAEGALVLDSLAIGEDAVLTRRRGGPDSGAAPALPTLSHRADGGLADRGAACATAALHRGTPPRPGSDGVARRARPIHLGGPRSVTGNHVDRGHPGVHPPLRPPPYPPAP